MLITVIILIANYFTLLVYNNIIVRLEISQIGIKSWQKHQEMQFGIEKQKLKKYKDTYY